jgi:hypothetical protein
MKAVVVHQCGQPGSTDELKMQRDRVPRAGEALVRLRGDRRLTSSTSITAVGLYPLPVPIPFPEWKEPERSKRSART